MCVKELGIKIAAAELLEFDVQKANQFVRRRGREENKIDGLR